MAIENRMLKANEKFVATFRGTRYVLQAVSVEKSKEGKQKATFRMIEPATYKGPKTGSVALQGGDDGKTFSSLSSAASALAMPGRWDGWKFWTREKEWKPALAIKARGEAAKGKPRPARAAKPKAEKASPKAKAAPKTKAVSGKVSRKPTATKVSTPATPKAKVSAKVAKSAKAPAIKAPAKSRNGASPNADSGKTPNVAVATASRGRGKSVEVSAIEDDIF